MNLYFAEVNPKDLRFAENRNKPRTARQWRETEDWKIAINGGLFRFSDNQPSGALALDGKEIRSGGFDPALFLWDGQRADIAPSPGFNSDWVSRITFAIQCGPWIVRDGMLSPPTGTELHRWNSLGIYPMIRRPRTFSALLRNGNVLIGVSPLASIPELAQRVYMLGNVKEAMCFDGGGSSQMSSNKGELLTSPRPVPNAIGAVDYLNLYPEPSKKSRPMIREGSRGDAVKEAQELLAQAGIDPGPIDGIFGPLTDFATRRFQHRYSLVVDGIIGPATWTALLEGTS